MRKHHRSHLLFWANIDHALVFIPCNQVISYTLTLSKAQAGAENGRHLRLLWFTSAKIVSRIFVKPHSIKDNCLIFEQRLHTATFDDKTDIHHIDLTIHPVKKN